MDPIALAAIVLIVGGILLAVAQKSRKPREEGLSSAAETPGPHMEAAPSAESVRRTRHWTRASMVVCAALWTCGAAFGPGGAAPILTSLFMALFLVMLGVHESDEYDHRLREMPVAGTGTDFTALAEQTRKKGPWLGCSGLLLVSGIVGAFAAIPAGERIVCTVMFVAGAPLLSRSAMFYFLGRKYRSRIPKPPAEQGSAEPAKEAEKAEKEDHQPVEERFQKQREELAAAKLHLTPIRALSDDERTHHVWIPGVSGCGKTTLMQWMAMNDIYDGIRVTDPDTKQTSVLTELGDAKLSGRKRGVTIIDPAGDLVSRILPWVPPERVPDTIYIDLKDPVPIDFLSCDDPSKKRNVVANLLSLFQHFSERTGSQVGKVMEDLLYPLLYTLLEARDVSFLDIYHFLQDEARRNQILSQPSISAEYRAHWRNTRLNIQETAPITRLMAPLAHDPVLKTIFGSRDAKLKLSDVILKNKILLVNLGGADPNDPSPKIIAALIVSKLIQAAMSQTELEPQRAYHMLYVDEFPQVHLSSDLQDIFSQLRKFHLCLTLANQWFDQIDESAFNGLLTVKNWYLFQLNFKDANLFRQAGLLIKDKELIDSLKEDLGIRRPSNLPKDYFMRVRESIKPFDVAELTRLEKFNVIHRDGTNPVTRVCSPGADFAAMQSTHSSADLIRKRTIEQYACPARNDAPADLESKRDDSGSAKPFNLNQGKTSGPKRPR